MSKVKTMLFDIKGIVHYESVPPVQSTKHFTF
jgi:hypothetical protein